MTRAEQRSAKLEETLRQRGMDRAGVQGQVDAAFGKPELAVASGSIAAGFGTPESDVDIIVVVSKPVPQVPVLSFAGSVRFDTEYYETSFVRHQFVLVAEGPEPGQPSNERRWRSGFRALRLLTRLEYGWVLSADDEWQRKIESLRCPEFRSVVSRWWTSEAMRRLMAADWVAATNPVLACLRLQDAIMSSLSASAAEAGELIMGKKWLPAKLKAMGDMPSFELLRTTLRLAGAPGERGAVERLRDIAVGLIPAGHDGDIFELSLASGVEVTSLDHELLCSRWNMRGAAVRADSAAVLRNAGPEALVWSGTVKDVPPAPLIRLFEKDMLWLGSRTGGFAARAVA